LFATNKQAFVNIMMLEELGLVVDDSNPMINGLITFIAFVVMGFLPLLPYVIGAGGLHKE
jgi:VIT1/CCC1 family predicted Fe2+/Mn2+ transporter